MGALTSFGDIKDLKEALTGGDPLLSAIAFAFLAFVVIRFAFKHIRAYWYKLGAGLAIGLLFLGFYGTVVGLIQLAAVAAVLLVVVVVVWLLCWRGCRKKLGRIVELADPMLPSFDDVGSFIEMQGVDSSRLTARQLDKFNRFRVSCHIALGDCNVARTLLSEGSFEPAFKHFSLGVIADGAGDHELFRAELDRAFASVTDATDAFVALQLEHNRAIAHVNEGQFRVADGDLEKVRAKVKARGFCNKAFLNLLYENLVLNKTRLDLPDGGASEGWALIDEYAESLDSANGADRGAVFNLKLLFLRQLGAGSDEKAGIFDAEVSDTLNDDSLSENQRAVAVASLGRIAWADGLDPTRVLDYFGKCDLGLEGLRPADRVFVFKNLFIMLGALRTSHPGLMGIADIVVAYYENGMSQDLDAWERTLPSEALRLRAQILRERAALCQVKGGDGSQVASYLDEAVRLLEQGLLIMDALEIRLELAKCLIANAPEDAKRCLPAIEERLASLGNQPALGYPYYELCLCYGLLGSRRECRAAYKKAISFKTAMDHYAPGVRGDVAMASFCARFYLMLGVLDSADRVRPLLRTDEGTAWLDAYPDGVNPLSLVILTGRFFGYRGRMPVARRTMAVGGSLLLACFWLVMPEFDLAFDPVAKLAGAERGGVFLHSGHPLVAADSNFEVLMRTGMEPLPLEGKSCDESELSEGERIAVADVLEALEVACKNARPTIDELMKNYESGCLDIPIE